MVEVAPLARLVNDWPRFDEVAGPSRWHFGLSGKLYKATLQERAYQKIMALADALGVKADVTFDEPPAPTRKAAPQIAYMPDGWVTGGLSYEEWMLAKRRNH